LYYFVIGVDGNRYGPADVDILVQWAREGRIVGSTLLIERGTERQVRADSLTALAVALQKQGALPVSIERGGSAREDAPTITQARSAYPPPPPPRDGLVPLHAERSAMGPKSKVVAGLLGIFLGGLGAHRFYLGYTGVGLIMLLLSVVGGVASLGASCGLVAVWGFIEGIVCLCGGMNDAQGRHLRD
jgi:TM2 domain-containing membrane protein YozV